MFGSIDFKERITALGKSEKGKALPTPGRKVPEVRPGLK
jgi:hypothetical protein